MSQQRRIGLAALISYVVSLVAAFGWGNHWNAYVNLFLTLGSLVLWTTAFTAAGSAAGEDT